MLYLILLYMIIGLLELNVAQFGRGERDFERETDRRASETDHRRFYKDREIRPHTTRQFKSFAMEPCDDFYEYTCSSLSEKDNISNLRRKLLQRLERSLRHEEIGSSAEEKAKDFFKSCIKATQDLESLVSQDFRHSSNNRYSSFDSSSKYRSTGENGLEKILLDLDRWSIVANKGNLQEQLEILHNQYGLNPLFNWRVGKDFKNPEKYVIEIYHEAHTFFGLDDPQESEPITKVVKESRWMRSLIARIVGGRLDERQLEQVIVLEDDLRKIMETPLPLLTNPTDLINRYNSITLSQLQQMANFINWGRFFEHALSPLNLRVQADERIIVWIPQYLTSLSDRLKRFQDENPRLLDNLLTWLAVKGIVGEIVVGGAEAIAVGQREENTAEHEICTRLTEQYFSFAVTRIFTQDAFDKAGIIQRKVAADMAEEIRDSLIQILQDAQNLDEISRRNAIDKAKRLRVEVGYPDFILHGAGLNNYYGGHQRLHMNSSNFVENVVKLLNSQRRRDSARLQMNTDLSRRGRDEQNRGSSRGNPVSIEWPNSVSPLSLTTFTDHFTNTIFIPISLLQSPFFDLRSPASENYGGLGWLIAREFFHGFTGLGSAFDKDGRFRSLWQTEITVQDMEQNSNCFIGQYSEFVTAQGRLLNGSSTLAENAPDNGGLDLISRTFFRRFPIKDNEEMANEFFKSFTKSLCDKSDNRNDGLRKDFYAFQPTSPNKFRVSGTLQNNLIFSRVLKCPAGSEMNPNNKCKIFS